MRFDWYAATVTGAGVTGETVREKLLGAPFFDDKQAAVEWRPARVPSRNYDHVGQLAIGSEVYATIWFGGNGGGVCVEGTGENATWVAEALRERFPGHRVTRVDVCEDLEGAGIFERLIGVLEVMRANGGFLSHSLVGDWPDGRLNGRTYYAGSRTSPVALRIYEKGKQLKLGDRQGWVRIEAMIRPKTHEQRVLVGTLSPEQCWGAAAWLRDFAKRVFEDIDLKVFKVGTVYRQTDRERRLRYLVDRYGKFLQELAEEQGSAEGLGVFLLAEIEKLRGEKQASLEYWEKLGSSALA